MWSTNIEEDTVKNKKWRKVIYTGKHLQVVLMSVPPGEELGWEIHDDPETDQFFRVEKGRGEVLVERKDGSVKVANVKDGWSAVVPGGFYHNVVNLSKTNSLNFYTIYAPPHHPKGTMDRTKEDEKRRERSSTKSKPRSRKQRK